MQGKWIRKPKSKTSVVFVHGILSSGEAGWRHENGSYWPELLKNDQELEPLGVYVFTYQTGIFSGNYRLSDIVDALKEHMRLDGVLESKQIVFVCHSMGGIVVRKFLVERATELIGAKIEIGLYLVASPSLGSSYANWLSPLAKFLKHAQADVLRFERSNAWLNDLDKEFQNLKEAGKLKIKGKELIEDKFILLKKFWHKQVVEPFAGFRYFGEPYKVPLSDHFSIAKPDGPDAIQHRLLCLFIKDVIVHSNFPINPETQEIPSTFLELCKKLVPLLNENERVFKSFGPNSGADSVGQLRWDTTLWEKSKQEIIVPNNKRIEGLIRSYNGLIPEKHKPIFDKMLAHIYAFEKHCQNPAFDYSEHQFPKQFSEIIGDTCFKVATKDSSILNIREWLVERMNTMGLRVIEGYFIGSILMSPSEAADIDIIIFLSDQSTDEIMDSTTKVDALKEHFKLEFGKPLHVTAFSISEQDKLRDFVGSVRHTWPLLERSK